MPKDGLYGEANAIINVERGDALVSYGGREYLVSYGEKGARTPTDTERRALMVARWNGSAVMAYSGKPPFSGLQARLEPLAWKAATVDLVVDCLNTSHQRAYRMRAGSVADVALDRWDVFPVVLARLTIRFSPSDLSAESAKYVPEGGAFKDLLVELRRRLRA